MNPVLRSLLAVIGGTFVSMAILLLCTIAVNGLGS